MDTEISDLVRSNVRMLREIRARAYDLERQNNPDLPSKNPYRKEHFHELCGLTAGQYKDLEYGDLPEAETSGIAADPKALNSKRTPRISVDRLVAIARALGVNVETLLLPPADWVAANSEISVAAENPTKTEPILKVRANDYALWILGLEPLPQQSPRQFRHHAFRLLPYMGRQKLMNRENDIRSLQSPEDMERERDERLRRFIDDLLNAPNSPSKHALLSWHGLPAEWLNESKSRDMYMASLDYVDLVRYLLDSLSAMLSTTRRFGEYTAHKSPQDQEMDDSWMIEACTHFDAVLEAVSERLLSADPPPRGR